MILNRIYLVWELDSKSMKLLLVIKEYFQSAASQLDKHNSLDMIF